MKKGDNFYVHKYKEWARDITSLASPLVLLFVPFIVLGWSQSFKHLLLLLLINEVLCSGIKYFFHKPRPDDQSYKGAMEKIDAGSFPSIHSSRITITYLFLIFHTTDLMIQVAIAVFMIAVYVSRVVLKRHFIIDVMGGSVIGALIFFIYQYIS